MSIFICLWGWSQIYIANWLLFATGWIEVAGAQIVYSCIEQRKDGNAKLTCSLAVHQADFRWHVEVDGRHLSCTSFPSTLPATISSVQDAQQIVDFINTSTICCGNDDDKFIFHLLKRRKHSWMFQVAIILLACQLCINLSIAIS